MGQNRGRDGLKEAGMAQNWALFGPRRAIVRKRQPPNGVAEVVISRLRREA